MTKHKEPAGLRRWRLAHKKKTRVVHTMARKRRAARRSYGRRRKGGRKSNGIALLPMAPLVPVIGGVIYNIENHSIKDIPRSIIRESTGVLINADGTYTFESDKAIREVALAVGGLVGHKVANKLGVNKYIRKFTLGYFQL